MLYCTQTYAVIQEVLMYQQINLPNGARLFTQHLPQAQSAALGFFVGVGSRHETPSENGAAHFIEHMLFKGTSRRSAGQLARDMDAIGGQVNAYTTKEHTCFYARTLDSRSVSFCTCSWVKFPARETTRLPAW